MQHDINKLVNSIDYNISKLEEYINQTRSTMKNILSSIDVSTDINIEELEKFIRKPYFIERINDNEARLIIPKFMNLDFGIIDYEDETYRVYKVNKLLAIAQNIPSSIKEQLGFTYHYDVDFLDDTTLIVKGNVDKFKYNYKQMIGGHVDANTFKLKNRKKLLFEAYRKLLKDGILPYKISPFPKDLIIEEEKFTLRDYQQKAWDLFLRYSSLMLFFPFGAGKSMFGLYALTRVKGKKLVIVNSNALKEQWKERIKKYNINAEVITYHVLKRYEKEEYTLIVYDEAHHAPSTVFSKVYWLKSEGRIGLTGSPFREDGYHELLFTLGYPYGSNWSEFFQKGIVPKPKVNVLIGNKDRQLRQLLTKNVRTNTILIFCDSIDKGKYLSKTITNMLRKMRYISKNVSIPFIYSQTPNKLERIRNTLNKQGVIVVSRIGDEGISLPDIDMVIEYDFLFGSKMQASQRLGRLMHSKSTIAGRYYVLMSDDEYKKYKKRLNAYYEKGIDVRIGGK